MRCWALRWWTLERVEPAERFKLQRMLGPGAGGQTRPISGGPPGASNSAGASARAGQQQSRTGRGCSCARALAVLAVLWPCEWVAQGASLPGGRAVIAQASLLVLVLVLQLSTVGVAATTTACASCPQPPLLPTALLSAHHLAIMSGSGVRCPSVHRTATVTPADTACRRARPSSPPASRWG